MHPGANSAPGALSVLLMKLLIRCVFALLLWCLAVQTGWAQCQTVPQPACSFEAVDDVTGQVLNEFCVGRRIRFRPCASRDPIIFNNTIYYGVLPGVGTTFQNTTPVPCRPTNVYPYVYTPTLAEVGMVTVSELSNENGVRYYIRSFRVYDSTPPAFTIAPCPTGSALVTVTDTKFDTYVAVAGSTSQPITPNVPTPVTVPAGVTSISVVGRYNIASVCEGTAAPQAIPAIAAPVRPVLSRLTLAGALPGGPATLAVDQLLPGYRYKVQVEDASAPGGFRDVVPPNVAPGAASVALPAPVAAGRYRIFRTDNCGNSQEGSILIGTLSLSGASANNRNQLLLTDASAGTPGITYTVTRNGAALPTVITTANGLEDADVQCGSTYIYIVTATQPGGGQAVSNPDTITTVSALPPVQPRLYASFNLRDVVELTPLLTGAPALPTGSTLRYRRSTGGQPVDFGSPATTLRAPRDSTSVTDLLASPPCYTVRLLDVCGNASPESPATCPALLTATAAADGSSAALTWTAFTGPNPAIPASYVLQRLDADGTVLSSFPVSGNSYTDLTPPTTRQTLRYRLQISGAGLPAGTFSYSNVGRASRPLLLTIPTAFTPNGDGLNDVLEVKGRYLANYTFVVVDRNGQEVFRGTQRSDAWDGRIGGRAPVLGAYVWRFQQDEDSGQRFTASGTVTILK